MTRADEIIAQIREITMSNKATDILNSDMWMNIAIELSVLIGDETKTLESMRRNVANMKLALMRSQEKKSVASVEMEIQASLEYEAMKNQEHKCDQLIEMIRIAKKNVDTNTL
jgi:hypothetical protein